MEETRDYNGPKPQLHGFLSSHESSEKIVEITTEPTPIYIEEARDSNNLNFDFTIKGLTDKKTRNQVRQGSHLRHPSQPDNI